VNLKGKLPVSLETEFSSEVQINANVPVRIGTVNIQKKALSIQIQQ
jgi:hypothetical protein